MNIIVIINNIMLIILISITILSKLIIEEILNIDSIIVIIYYDKRLKLEKSFSKIIIKVNNANFIFKTL